MQKSTTLSHDRCQMHKPYLKSSRLSKSLTDIVYIFYVRALNPCRTLYEFRYSTTFQIHCRSLYTDWQEFYQISKVHSQFEAWFLQVLQQYRRQQARLRYQEYATGHVLNRIMELRILHNFQIKPM